MKNKRRTFLIVIILMVSILILKAILFFTAKPEIIIDYSSQINALSKPSDYDPNKDGHKYLIEASELYVKAPANIAWELWPHEMNDTEISLLKQWLADNSKTLDAFRKASESNYIWMELKRNSSRSVCGSSKCLDNEIKVRDCLFWRAKLEAFDGDFESTLEDMITAWRYGIKCSNPNYPLRMQISSLLERQRVLDTAIDIIDVYKLPSADLSKWQRQWQKQFELDSYTPGLEAEKLDCYDRIQRAFIHKDNGIGRLYWGRFREFIYPCENSSILNFLLIPVTGPTESDVRARVDSIITHYKDIVVQPPWKVRYAEQQYIEFQEDYNKMPRYCDYFIPPLHSFTIFYHRVKMRQEAFSTILAILDFNTHHSRYPFSLGEIIKEGFLKDLPRDPFSRGPLIYNQLDDDFELYSVGPDFSDDGGKIYQGTNSFTGAPTGDEVFWPPLRKGRKNIKVVDMRILGNY